MRVPAPFLVALLAAVALCAGCAAPGPLIGGAPERSAAAKGGDAEGDTMATKTYLSLAQPGADSRLVPIENSDQVTSTQAAPGFTLNLVADVGAAIANDPLVRSMVDGLADAQRRANAAETPEAEAAALARVDAERAALAARLDKLRADFSPGSAASVSSLYFQPIVIMSNAEDLQRLDAQTAREAARGLLGAVLAGLDDETAKLVAQALLAPPLPPPAE